MLKICLRDSYQDPFEDYKTRLAKKLARRDASQSSSAPVPTSDEKPSDDTNWFGLKIGETAGSNCNTGGGGVGKYLNAKRPQDEQAGRHGGSEGPAKKRKIGFGNFEGW